MLEIIIATLGIYSSLFFSSINIEKSMKKRLVNIVKDNNYQLLDKNKLFESIEFKNKLNKNTLFIPFINIKTTTNRLDEFLELELIIVRSFENSKYVKSNNEKTKDTSICKNKEIESLEQLKNTLINTTSSNELKNNKTKTK